MEVTEAVLAAKNYVLEIFGEEGIVNVGLEEVQSKGRTWIITIGFSRPWDRNVGPILGGNTGRTYKDIEIRDEDGRILSVKDRNLSKFP